jgi:hypothetical protein
MANNMTDASDKELALWMLDRMRDSDEFLGVIRAARSAGEPHILDTPDIAAQHTSRLTPLYQGDTEVALEASDALVAAMEKAKARNLLSCDEELLEKALAAFLAAHPKNGEGAPSDWPATFDLAKDEIEGRTSGAFKAGFVAELASAARVELARSASVGQSRLSGRESE